MISCQDADVLAAALSVGSINAADQATLQRHLAGCADCRRTAGEYMAAAAHLPLALEPVGPPPELRGRLMRAVYAEAADAKQRAASAQPSPWWRRVWQAVPASRGLTAAAGVAVVLVIGLSSWAVASHQNGPPASVAVTLAAGQGAPHAQARLTYQRGGEAVLTATGLPSPSTIAAGASVYEVWLIRRDGSSVAAAFLSQDPDGTWSAAIPGDLTSYSAVAATPEPAGGSPGPTGARVIQGALSGS